MSSFTSESDSNESRIDLYKEILKALGNNPHNEYSPYLLFSFWNQPLMYPVFRFVIKYTSPAASRAMVVWVPLIVVLTAVGFATALLGLVVTIALLGYATWHGYRETIDASAWPEN